MKFVTLNPNYLEKEDCIRNFGKLVIIFNLSSVAILQMVESILNVIPKVYFSMSLNSFFQLDNFLDNDCYGHLICLFAYHFLNILLIHFNSFWINWLQVSIADKIDNALMSFYNFRFKINHFFICLLLILPPSWITWIHVLTNQ